MNTAKLRIIAIGKILAFLIVPVFVYLFIVNSSLTAIGPVVNVYTPSDEETNYLTALSVYQGDGLYQNFSISYPPGRFLAQALFFRITGPTVISARIYMNLFTPLLFPTLLFLLTYLLLRRLKLKFLPAYLLGWLAVSLDITLVHSAQEVHVLLAAFGLVLLSHWRSSVRTFCLGLLLGLVFLFRFEAGIIVTLSLILSYQAGAAKRPDSRALPIYSVAGFAVVWLPVLINLLVHSTLGNFFYDTVILGLFTQPRVMGQPIPPNALWYVFLSSLILVFSLGLSLGQQSSRPLRVIAGIALFSYMTALGRSDEGHLWYGLVWLPLLVPYAVTQFRPVRVFPALTIGIGLLAVGYLLILVKSPAFFLVVGTLAIFLVPRWAKYSRETAVAGTIVALLVFHSFRYFTLRFQLPRYAGTLAHPWTQTAAPDAIGGLDFPPTTLATLSQIKSQITGANPSLFIFPENTLYYEYFGLPRPTRYIYLTGERTARTEAEIIQSLASTPNLYVLVFPEKATHRGGEVWSWIKAQTNAIYSSPYQSTVIELRQQN